MALNSPIKPKPELDAALTRAADDPQLLGKFVEVVAQFEQQGLDLKALRKNLDNGSKIEVVRIGILAVMLNAAVLQERLINLLCVAFQREMQ